MYNLSLILPVHNEEDIIEPVFKDIKKVLDTLRTPYECILVENGSTDNSLKTIKELSKKYKNTSAIVSKKGYGNAVIAGLKVAKGKHVSYMPSDGQIDMTIFPKIWKELINNKLDLVKIKRANRESFIRTFVSNTFSWTLKILFGTPLWDINGSPRIFLKNHLAVLDLQHKDSFIDGEFAVKIHYLNWKIKEIPMKNLERVGGESTRSWRTFYEFFKNIYKFKTNKNLSTWKKKNSKLINSQKKH